MLPQELLRFLSLRCRYMGIALQTLAETGFAGEGREVARTFIENAGALAKEESTMQELAALDTDAAVQGPDASFANVCMSWQTCFELANISEAGEVTVRSEARFLCFP